MEAPMQPMTPCAAQSASNELHEHDQSTVTRLYVDRAHDVITRMCQRLLCSKYGWAVLHRGVAYAITANSWLSPFRRPSSHMTLATAVGTMPTAAEAAAADTVGMTVGSVCK